MSSSFDEEIFVRGPCSFVLSQRFRNMCSIFRGTFNLAVQSVSTIFLQRTLPQELSNTVFFNFLFFLMILYILLAYEFIDGRIRRREDRDLFDVIKRLVKHVGFVQMAIVVVLVKTIGELIYVGLVVNFEVTQYYYFLVLGMILVLIIIIYKVVHEQL